MINKWETNKKKQARKFNKKHIRGPVDWVGMVLPEAKLENKTTLFFEIFWFERPIARYLLKTILHCKGSRIWGNAITEVYHYFWGRVMCQPDIFVLGFCRRLATFYLKRMGVLDSLTSSHEGCCFPCTPSPDTPPHLLSPKRNKAVKNAPKTYWWGTFCIGGLLNSPLLVWGYLGRHQGGRRPGGAASPSMDEFCQN